MTTDEIKKLKVARVKCDKSLLFFTRYFFKKKFNRKFVINHHHEKICDALERVLKGDCTRLMINIAPRYGKTELAVKNFVAHALSINPAAKFIHLSYSDDLALDNSEEIRDLLQEDFYKELYSDIDIKKDSKSKKKWYTDNGGGVYATSSSGQVTGFGAGKVDEEEDINSINDVISHIDSKEGFGGAIIIDDPIKPDDATSDTKRDLINNKYDSTIKNRVNSRNTPIIIIMQRVHEQDLCGYLLENDTEEWEVLSFPCLYEEDGEEKALWPFKHTVEELKKLKKANEKVYDTQYQQDPTTKEGLMFPKGDLLRFKELNKQIEDCPIFAYIDTADSGEDSLAMPVVKVINKKAYLIDVIFTKENLTVTEDQIVAKCKELGIDHLFVENNKEGTLFVNNLRKRLNISVYGIRNSTKKTERIWAQSGFIMENFVFKEEFEPLSEYGKFMKELTGYLKTGKVKHDDSPDSLAGISKILRSRFYYLFEEEE